MKNFPKKIFTFSFIISLLVTLSSNFIAYSKVPSTSEQSIYDFNKNFIEDICNGDEGFVPNKEKRWQSGGFNHTHQFITSYSIYMLVKDRGEFYGHMIYPYAHYLLIGSDLPDIDEKNKLYAYHFYNPLINKNYLLSHPTGRDMFIYHMAQARYFYNIDKNKSFEHLGRAMHFLQDINNPHHSTNSTAFESNHSVFEDWVDKRRLDYKLPNGSLYFKYKSLSFDKFLLTLFDDSAFHSYVRIDDAESKTLTPWGVYPLLINDYSKWNECAKQCIYFSENVCSALLYRFINEVEQPTGLKSAMN